MPTTDYNGWPNRATWNAHLWLTGNDQPTYLYARSIAATYATPDAARRLQSYCVRKWGETTPDGDRLNLVDWRLLAVALLEDNR
jgi:hypothetical protein